MRGAVTISPMVAPISLCMIVRDEAPRIRKCLESIRPFVAEICLTDNGSKDGTLEVARGLYDRSQEWFGANENGSRDGKIENFAELRQKSFELATQPWVMWIDGDDVVRGAEHLEQICKDFESTPTPTWLLFTYDYSHDHLGNVTCTHQRERLVRAGTCKWLSPVHEVLVPTRPIDMRYEPRVKIVHDRVGKEGENRRNLRILEKWFATHPDEDDVRLLYYMGLELGNVGDLGKSIEFHTRYVARSGWDDEKCLSCLEISQHHLTLGNLDDAERWALKASGVCETWREPLFQLGKVHYARACASKAHRDWLRAANFFRKGLALPPTNTPLFINPMEARWNVHQHQVFALTQIGAIHEALASCETALQVIADDPNFLHNKRWLSGMIAKLQLESEISKLVELGKIRADYGISEEQAWIIRNVLEGRFGKQPANQTTTAPVKSTPITGGKSKLDVVLFTGAAWERWNPKTLEAGGMGGSETMAWEMSRRLAKLGHRVRVFADCMGIEGTFEGVDWIDYTRFVDSPIKCDAMISSRIPELVDYPFEARARVAWVHDVHMGAGLTNARALKFDRYLCLSNWHKGYFLDTYKYVHSSAVVVTRNGIDLSRYEGSEARDPHRMIYSSSPDRGLQVALQCMPAIRAYVPDATLHVFYGFENWLKNPDEKQRNLAHAILGMIKAYEPFGVVHRGRVSGRDLAREQMRSGVWGYPTWFSETSCISAMEVQAAGLRIVTSPIAALNETVGENGYMISGDWLSPEYSRAFIERVVACMSEPESAGNGPKSDRERLKERARRDFSLDALALEWEAMLARFCVEIEEEVIPRYRAVGE